MITKEDEQIIISFVKDYRQRASTVSDYKDQLMILQKNIEKELQEMEEVRAKELIFLEELYKKHDDNFINRDKVINTIQQIIMSI